MKKEMFIPFRADNGNQIDYHGGSFDEAFTNQRVINDKEIRAVWSYYSGTQAADVIAILNEPFQAEYHILHHERGRSASYIRLKKVGGGECLCSVEDFLDMTKNGYVQKDIYGETVLKGTFIYCKKGANYRLKGYYK